MVYLVRYSSFEQNLEQMKQNQGIVFLLIASLLTRIVGAIAPLEGWLYACSQQIDEGNCCFLGMTF
jgi:hypothetical protein